MKSILLALLLTLIPVSALSETPFQFTLDLEQKVFVQTNSDALGLSLAPSLAEANDGEFFLYVNTAEYSGGAPSDCATGFNLGSCYSMTEWTERNVDGLLSYEPFQDWLQSEVDKLFVEALMETSMKVPLIGEFNIAVYVEDIWNDEGCSNPQSGPQTLANPDVRIGCKFGDANDKAVDVKAELLSPFKYDFDIDVNGMDNFDPISTTTDGDTTLYFWIDSIDVDIQFKQPVTPTITAGFYLHGAGKMRIKNLVIAVDVNSIGGDLVRMPSPGYGIGLSLRGAYISGSLTLDLDSYDCTYNNSCDASKLPISHPYYNDQANYESKTNSISALIGDAIRYLEVHFVYEAERVSGEVAEYLTAMELFDMQSFTHTKQAGGNYAKPIFEHPFGGAVEYDYGFFYRWDSEYDNNISLFGGLGMDFWYTDHGCDIELPSGERVPSLGKPDMVDDTFRNFRDTSFGLGIHVNALNRVLDNVWKSGVACFTISKDTLGGELMNTDVFRAFIPSLNERYFGRDMMVKIVPAYVSPSSSIVEYDSERDQPMFFLGNTEPENIINKNDPRPFDVHLRIPHMRMEYYVSGDSGWIKAFAFDVSTNLYFGLGWYRLDPASTHWVSSLDGTDCDQPYVPCRVLRVGMHIENRINEFINYNLHGLIDKPTLEDSVSQLLAALINNRLQGHFEVVTNIGSHNSLGMTFDPSTPFLADTDPLFKGTVLEPADLDGDGVNEYLGLWFKIADINGGVDDGPDGFSDTIAPAVLFNIIRQQVALAPDSSSPTYTKPNVWTDKTFIRNFDLTPVEIKAGSWGHVSHYEYQIDDGYFQYSKDGNIFIPAMFEGKHIVKVWAVDENAVLSTPATIEYVQEFPEVYEDPVTSVKGWGCNSGKGPARELSLIMLMLIIGWALYVAKKRP